MGLAAAVAVHRHALAVARVAPDRPTDAPVVAAGEAPDEGAVLAFDAVVVELPGQGDVGGVALRHHEDPRRP